MTVVGPVHSLPTGVLKPSAQRLNTKIQPEPQKLFFAKSCGGSSIWVESFVDSSGLGVGPPAERTLLGIFSLSRWLWNCATLIAIDREMLCVHEQCCVMIREVHTHTQTSCMELVCFDEMLDRTICGILMQ